MNSILSNIFSKTVFIALFCLPITLFAQKISKEEQKRLQAELKALAKQPEKLKALKAESEELMVTENVRNAQFINLNAKLKQQETDIKKLDETVARAEADKNSPILKSPQEGNVINKNNTKSLAMFRVQIGAYLSPQLAQSLQVKEGFEIEPMDNGMKRYLIGYFVSFQEAQVFKERLVRLGAQAYTVGYLNGKRVENLKDMPTQYLQR
jgi:hypothetical protein